MGVTPIHAEMTSAGRGSRTQVSVVNNSRAPLPVEVVTQRLAIDHSGGRKMSKAGDQFLIFPPQALIPPGGTQVFRIQWVGQPDLKSSESYMINFDQIPVKMPKGKSAVQVVLGFGVMVNVAPPRGVADLKVSGTGTTRDQKTGKLRPTVTIVNNAPVHGLVPDGKLRVSAGSWSHTFTATEMREKIGIGLVQPGKRRRSSAGRPAGGREQGHGDTRLPSEAPLTRADPSEPVM